MRETIFRQKQGMIQEVIPNMILAKAPEDWRLVSPFLLKVGAFKAPRRSPAREEVPIRNGDA
jgi:hypothetical protein